MPLAVGNFAGFLEAILEREPGVEYEETRPGVYRITVYEAENPAELKSRLRWRGYGMEYKEGDFEFERCASCGAPLALREFRWDLAHGSIRSTVTGRRMVMTGPSMIDPSSTSWRRSWARLSPAWWWRPRNSSSSPASSPWTRW
ncbi:hypothetical protein [Candidatus Solincola sp.]|nr:hypothetical protein [Actinomycetota bacterium]MDI7251095.1 hypothetical protein [Actinomycetota bacterium]